MLDNYHRNFDRTSESMCRIAINFTLNEYLTVMVSRPELSPKTLLNIGNPQKGNENTGHGDARQKTPSSLNHTARCISPTRLLFQQPLVLLSVVASITALVVSSIAVLRILSTSVDVASTRCYSLSRPSLTSVSTLL